MTSTNLITVNEGTSLRMRNKYQNISEKLPVVSKENILVGLITFRDITKHTTKPNANKDKFGRLRVAAAVGITNDVMTELMHLKVQG